jgi:hypothetical protein
MTLYKQLNHILGTISQTVLFGWLPLDIVLHLLIGAAMMIIIQKIRKSAIQAFFFCLTVALLKELYDSQTLVATWSEAIKDFLITMIYPTCILIVIFFRKKLDQE